MNLCRASILLVLSCAVTFVQADVDKRFYKKRIMGLDLRVKEGLGPTPVNSFDPVNTKFLEAGNLVHICCRKTTKGYVFSFFLIFG